LKYRGFSFLFKKLPGTKVVDVICGGSRGELHLEKFICPGINQKCIKLEGYDTFYTPNQFMYMGGDEAHLGDWTEALKIKGIPIR
jgi:hypothetical protein